MSYGDGPTPKTIRGTRNLSTGKVEQGSRIETRFGVQGQTVKNLEDAKGAARNKARANHNHDERYYTETEIDALFAALSADVRQVEDQQAIVAFDPGNIDEDLLPVTSNLYDIGSETHAFKDMHLTGHILLQGSTSSIQFAAPERSMKYSSSNDNVIFNLGGSGGGTLRVQGNILLDGPGVTLAFNDGTSIDTAPPRNLTQLDDVDDVTLVHNMVLQWSEITGKWTPKDDFHLLDNIYADLVKSDSVWATENLMLGDNDTNDDVTLDVKNIGEPPMEGSALVSGAYDGSKYATAWLKPATYDHTHVNTFLDLVDAPNSFTGQAGEYVTVNGSSNALVFTPFPTLFLNSSLADVSVGTPAVNEILVWNGTDWTASSSFNGTSVTASAASIDALAVVDSLGLDGTNYTISTLGSGNTGEVLRVDGAALEWVHMPTQLEDLSDVGSDTYSAHDIFRFNGTQWYGSRNLDGLLSVESTTLECDALKVDDLTFTSGASHTVSVPTVAPTDGQILTVDTSTTPDQLSWADNSLDNLSDTNLNNVQADQILKRFGGNWVNSSNLALSSIIVSGLGAFDEVRALNTLDIQGDVKFNNNTYSAATMGAGQNGEVLGISGGNLAWLNNTIVDEFIQLEDTPTDYLGDAGKYLKVNGTADGIIFDTLNFNDLGDLDGSVAANGGKYLKVNTGGTQVEFVDAVSASWDGSLTADIVPDGNGPYNIGTVANPIDTIYCDDVQMSGNSIYMDDVHAVKVQDGSVKFLERKTDIVPSTIIALGGSSNGAITHSGESTLSDISRQQWVAYAQTLAGGGSSTVSSIWPAKGQAGYSANDYENISGSGVEGTMTGHIIPDSNAAYDLGNAEYKIRHLFLSDNSMWVGDTTKITATGGILKTYQRDAAVVPAAITALGGDSAGALAHSGESSLKLMSLDQWVKYGDTLDSGFTVSDLYPAVGHANYTDDDYSAISKPGQQNGKNVSNEMNGAGPFTMDLKSTSRMVINGATDNFGLSFTNSSNSNGTSFKAKVFQVIKGVTSNVLDENAVTIDGQSVHVTMITTPSIVTYSLVTYLFDFVKAEGYWFANVTVEAGSKNTAFELQEQNNPL